MFCRIYKVSPCILQSLLLFCTYSQQLTPARVVLSIREELPPYTAGISDMVLSLDYLPFIKEVCVAENVRRASKTSRRFVSNLCISCHKL